MTGSLSVYPVPGSTAEAGEGNTMLKNRYAGLRENKPNLGSDSYSYCNVVCEKARKTLLFGSYGGYA